MTREEIEACIGVGASCTDSDNRRNSTDSIHDASSDECTAGFCRLNTDCHCVKRFQQSTVLQEECKQRFGEVWPQSTGKVESTRKYCGAENSEDSRTPSSSPLPITNSNSNSSSNNGVSTLALVGIVVGGIVGIDAVILCCANLYQQRFSQDS